MSPSIRTRFVALLLPLQLAASHAAETPELRYAEIRPILEAHCVDCHSGWFPKAGLRLDSRAGVLEGGRSGPAIVPGRADQGYLMRALRLPDGHRGKMPPGDGRLSEAEIERLRVWIHQGAH